MDIQNQQIKKIEGRVCCSIRPLWEEGFCDDIRLFMDSSFENRVEKSSALVMEEDGKAQAMLWLTGGRLRMKTGNSSQVIEADYAAGAVSGETQRHSGFMGRLLREACLQQYEQKHPFMYLLPDAAAEYELFQFIYVFNKPKWTLQPEFILKVLPLLKGETREIISIRYERKILQAAEDVREEKLHTGSDMLQIRPMEEADISHVADFAASWLEHRCQLFAERSGDYYRMALQEMHARQGDIFLLLNDDNVVGYFLYGPDKNEEIQEVLVLPEYEELLIEPAPERRPAVMGRIMHLPSMLSLIRSRQKIEVFMKYTDNLIEENNGYFYWKSGPEESVVKKIGSEEVKGKLYAETSADRFCAFLFGREPAEKCFTFNGGYLWEMVGLLHSLEQVQTLSDICVNEII